MLLITDFGCDLHLLRRLKYFGPEAQVMRDVIANLHSEDDCHTYICEHGHTHRLAVEAPMRETLTDTVLELSSH